MVNQVNAARRQAQVVYTDQAKRSAWREEMLGKVLAKVREVSPTMEAGQLSLPSTMPVKGGLLDVFV